MTLNNILASLLIRIPFRIPDENYIKLLYRLKFGKKLNLENPKTFQEKLQWLKLYNKNHNYTQMVDKYEVKSYMSALIGEQYIIPTLGVWDKPEDIDWDKLPQQFVLKTTHGGGNGGVVVCQDKSKLSIKQAVAKLQQSMKQDIYKIYREWPYKNVKKRIIAEAYMSDNSEFNKGDLTDYKFYCFNGNAYKVMVCTDRNIGKPKFYSFDKDWNLLRHNNMGKAAPIDFSLPKPDGMDEMFRLVEKIAANIPFARVDMYYVKGQIYFGEVTFYPASGFDPNILPEIDLLYGQMLKLPSKSKL